MKRFTLNNKQNLIYNEAYTTYLTLSKINGTPKEEIYNYSEFFDEVFCTLGLNALYGIYKQGKTPRKHNK